MNQQIFEMASSRGTMLRGILTVPERVTANPVLILPAGLKYRAGPARLYVDLTRWLEQRGHPVLRFDPHGLGESDGEIEGGPVPELWNTVEQGRFVDDGLTMLEALCSQFAPAKVYLSGLCGGAITSQLMAEAAPTKVAGIISFNTPVTMSGAKTAGNKVGTVEARHNLQAYSRRLNSIDAWKRVLTLESSYSSVWASVVGGVRGWAGLSDSEIARVQLGLNPLFSRSLENLLKQSVPQLFLFSQNDSRWPKFLELIVPSELRGSLDGPSYAVRMIPVANHEFHMPEWRTAAFREIGKWLEGQETL